MSGGIARIERRFANLREAERAGLVAFVMAGDPDPETFEGILRGLPEAGADLIEIGMPFTDPMADGPSVQLAGQRALKAGIKLPAILQAVTRFRSHDAQTPLLLMGYYNPIYSYGVDRFLGDAAAAGVDGLIIVDLPPEEDEELCRPALRQGLGFIRLATPTTDDARLPAVLNSTNGFLYYVSYTGITGARSVDGPQVAKAVARLKRHTDLPVAVGFGIRTAEQAAMVATAADAVVVGSAIVDAVKDGLDAEGRATPECTRHALSLVGALAAGVRSARLSRDSAEASA